MSKPSRLAWLWTLLFGTFYFIIKGIWIHAVLSIVFAILTMGLSWLIYPLFANTIVKNHYLRQQYLFRKID